MYFRFRILPSESDSVVIVGINGLFKGNELFSAILLRLSSFTNSIHTFVALGLLLFT